VISGFAPLRERWSFSQVKLSSSPGDVALGPSSQWCVALEIAPRRRLLFRTGDTGEHDVDEAERDLDSRRDLRARVRVPGLDRKRRHAGLMPVIVLGMKERDSGRMCHDDVAIGVEQLLRRHGALVVVDAVDFARCDLAAAADLQVTRAEIDVSRREAQPLALVVVLDRQVVWDLLDDVRMERLLRRRLGGGPGDRSDR